MMFKDRTEAGQKLADKLISYKNKPDTVVVGLARGGVVVAAAVAGQLHLPLEVICPRKLGAPFNPELAIGAITEKGESVLNDDLVAQLNISENYIQKIQVQETQTAQNRVKKYRQKRPEISFTGKTVILVDDGLATGATMRAAIKSAHSSDAEKIVVAVPVSPPDTAVQVEAEVDEWVCLSIPPYFLAVGQFYQVFDQIEDEEVINLLSSAKRTD